MIIEIKSIYIYITIDPWLDDIKDCSVQGRIYVGIFSTKWQFLEKTVWVELFLTFGIWRKFDSVEVVKHVLALKLWTGGTKDWSSSEYLPRK